MLLCTESLKTVVMNDLCSIAVDMAHLASPVPTHRCCVVHVKWRKSVGDHIASMDMVAGVLSGHTRDIARLITRAEGGEPECRAALAEIYKRTGRAHVIGITGVPGSGKSTLVTELVLALRKDGRRVGVVAIDPSSPFSGGAILGDRIRMDKLVTDEGVFIRSMATRGSLGGLARAALDAVDLLDAGGYETILIETVGVGQDEVDVVQAAHTTIVVSAPGLGDDIQAIKAGVLEIADIHAVSKVDRPDANRTVRELKDMLRLSLSLSKDGNAKRWQIPVIATSAKTGEGIAQLVTAIDRHHEHLVTDDRLKAKQYAIGATRTVKIAEEIVRDNFARHQRNSLSSLLQRVSDRKTDPYTAAAELLRTLENKL